MSSEISTLLESVKWRCLKCGSTNGCQCWEPCECGWTKLRLGDCNNPVHKEPFSLLTPMVEPWYYIGEDGKVRNTISTMKAISDAIQSGNIFFTRKETNAALRQTKQLGISIQKWCFWRTQNRLPQQNKKEHKRAKHA